MNMQLDLIGSGNYFKLLLIRNKIELLCHHLNEKAKIKKQFLRIING